MSSKRRAHIHTYLHIFTHTYTHTHIHTRTHTYTHVHTRTYTYIHVHTRTYTYIHAYVHTCIRAYMHTCIHAYMHTCTHAHIHTCTHAYMHTCTHAHIHTCTHTYIHTYMHTELACATRAARAPREHRSCTDCRVVATSQTLREEPKTRTGVVPSFACRSGRLNLPYIIVTRCLVSLRFFFLRYLEELLRLSELGDGDTIQMPEALVVSDIWMVLFRLFLSFLLLSLFCLFSLHFVPYCFPVSRVHALRSNSVVRRYSSYISLPLLEVFWKCLRFQRIVGSTVDTFASVPVTSLGSCVQAEFQKFLLRAPRWKNQYCWRQTLQSSLEPFAVAHEEMLVTILLRRVHFWFGKPVLPCFTEAARLVVDYSGMCMAGFARDTALRAVFPEFLVGLVRPGIMMVLTSAECDTFCALQACLEGGH